MKERYGMGHFLERGHYGKSLGSEAGGRMLLARRLVEAGARFVSLTYGSWDTHTLLRESYQTQMPAFDHAIAALKMVDAGILSSNTRGGPSGELGHMQFLAGNWVRFAKDGNGELLNFR